MRCNNNNKNKTRLRHWNWFACSCFFIRLDLFYENDPKWTLIPARVFCPVSVRFGSKKESARGQNSKKAKEIASKWKRWSSTKDRTREGNREKETEDAVIHRENRKHSLHNVIYIRFFWWKCSAVCVYLSSNAFVALYMELCCIKFMQNANEQRKCVNKIEKQMSWKRNQHFWVVYVCVAVDVRVKFAMKPTTKTHGSVYMSKIM